MYDSFSYFNIFKSLTTCLVTSVMSSFNFSRISCSITFLFYHYFFCFYISADITAFYFFELLRLFEDGYCSCMESRMFRWWWTGFIFWLEPFNWPPMLTSKPTSPITLAPNPWLRYPTPSALLRGSWASSEWLLPKLSLPPPFPDTTMLLLFWS